MANNKIFVIFLIFVLHFTAFSQAHASVADLNGWTITDRIQNGATRTYNASKTAIINGANVAKTSFAKYAPDASKVAKGIGRTGGVLAVTLAIEAILGSVDYVLDPANNRVIYYVDPATDGEGLEGWCYFTSLTSTRCASNPPQTTSSPKSEAANYCQHWWGGGVIQQVSVDTKDSNWHYYRFHCYLTKNPENTPPALVDVIGKKFADDVIPEEKEERYLPYESVASEILGQADGGVVAAADYVGNVADFELENDQSVRRAIADQLDANANTEAPPQVVKPKPLDPTAPPNTLPDLELPAACAWMPTVCEAATAVINLPTKLENWVNDGTQYVKTKVQEITDFFKAETEQNTEVDIQDHSSTNVDTQVQFSSGCPSPITRSLNYHGKSVEFGITDFTPFCNMLNTYLKPVVVSISSFIAVLIIGGVRTNES